MDRLLSSKWFFYVVIGLGVAYLWVHVEWLRNTCRMLLVNWWH